ncbi:DUF4760 domain-containing protein [uncultured Draconibacterium sp.]|uniref:DUF4760 domain-containing protein n=1 Tax=uncultured Draconibacterium sp. TaxID=1573823 RepID=UPI0029C89145|nr:DUF4760 domain-containing protein [uncultured Draconibacterium sp.]
MKADIVSFLDYFEVFSIAIIKNVVDKEIAYHYFYFAFTRYYYLLKPFIHFLRNHDDPEKALPLKLFGHFEIVSEEWITRMEKESRQMKKWDSDKRYRRMMKNPVYEWKK